MCANKEFYEMESCVYHGCFPSKGPPSGPLHTLYIMKKETRSSRDLMTISLSCSDMKDATEAKYPSMG